MTFPACRFCISWKRLSDAHGQCWSQSWNVVPMPKFEHERCGKFVDQLVAGTREAWQRERLQREPDGTR
jgi:hypothetical protein